METEHQGYVLQCGQSLTALARSCGDAFRGSVGGLSEQHRTVLQYVMRIAIAQTQAPTQEYTPSPSVSVTPNSGTIPGNSSIMNTPNIHAEAPSPVISPAPVSIPVGGLKFDVSSSLPTRLLFLWSHLFITHHARYKHM